MNAECVEEKSRTISTKNYGGDILYIKISDDKVMKNSEDLTLSSYVKGGDS